MVRLGKRWEREKHRIREKTRLGREKDEIKKQEKSKKEKQNAHNSVITN